VAASRGKRRNSACGFFAAAPDRAALNQEAGDFPSMQTFFHGRGKGNLLRRDG